METISKSKIKWIRSLRLQKHREEEQAFVVFGTKIVQELLRDFPHYIQFVCTTNPAFTCDATVFAIRPQDMKLLGEFKSDPEVMAVVNYPNIEVVDKGITLVLDGIQDPGNLGTIIRTADWFGVSQIVCSLDTVDCFNAKVIQSSMGSIFRVSVQYRDLVPYLKEANVPVYGALLEGEPITGPLPVTSCVLIIGNEGRGIRSEIRTLVKHPVSIPSRGKAESLNAAIATGILLAYFTLKQ